MLTKGQTAQQVYELTGASVSTKVIRAFDDMKLKAEGKRRDRVRAFFEPISSPDWAK